MIHPCRHERWQYCRRKSQNGSLHFGAQCLQCLDCIKLERHDHKLWLKPDDIPTDETIHAYIERGDQHE